MRTDKATSVPSQKRGAMIVKTKPGYMAVGFCEKLVARVWLPGLALKGLKREIAQWSNHENIVDETLAKQLVDYFDGKSVNFNHKLKLWTCSDFAGKVYSELMKVGWGKTVTYGQLARMAGKDGAGRAVGNIMSRNLIPLLIPCHRVTRGDGSLGGFTAPGGVTLKEKMLRLESNG